MEDQETDQVTGSLRDLVLGGGPAESELVLSLFDETSKAACFERFWERLQASTGRIDLDTLRLCIRLLSSGEQVSGLSKSVCSSHSWAACCQLQMTNSLTIIRMIPHTKGSVPSLYSASLQKGKMLPVFMVCLSFV
jgi:hypothetical protein